MGEATYLEQSILHTIRYFDILGVPRTATQLWSCLLIPNSATQVRWEGHQRFSLAQVAAALRESVYLQAQLENYWGYYFLKGRGHLVSQRVYRHSIAQQKWKIVQRSLRWLRLIPCVDMVAASGSLALYNTKPSSDLDMLIIARPERMWTARLMVLFMAQLLGRRRKHWDQAAPDKLCFNHFLSSRALAIAPAIRNEYTAVLYLHLVPLTGRSVYQKFMAANHTWLRRFVMYEPLPALASIHWHALPRWQKKIRHATQALLLEPIGAGVEYLARTWQMRTIARHTHPGQQGRVVVSADELAFHPHSRVEGILHQFAQEAGQKRLL